MSALQEKEGDCSERAIKYRYQIISSYRGIRKKMKMHDLTEEKFVMKQQETLYVKKIKCT